MIKPIFINMLHYFKLYANVFNVNAFITYAQIL